VKRLFLAALVTLAPPVAAQDWKEALREERFADAWDVVEREPDLALRRRAQVEILLGAGDPAGALAFAEDGLVSRPSDLELLFRATSAAIWLRAGGRAREASGRLTAALEEAELSSEDRAAWDRSLAEMIARIEALERSESERERGLATSRALALALLAAALLGLGLLLVVPGGVVPREEDAGG
jgi:hypothetical protein